MKVAFVTGTDARLFWNACALCESFTQQNPGHRVQVADFGLTPSQGKFLRGLGILSESPATQDRLTHPWICKTALPTFIAGEFDALAWIDADMLAVGPAAEDAVAIASALNEHGGSAAVCRDDSGLSLGEFIAAYREAAMPVEPFDNLLTQRGVNRNSPYLNTGFFIITDRRFWPAWQELTSTIEQHVAFDQSTFNALVHSSSFHYIELDARSWNVHNSLLAAHGFVEARIDEPARFLHPTSQASEHHQWERLNVSVDGVETSLEFKTFRRDDLRRLHLESLQRFISRHLSDLRAAGLINCC